MSQVSIDHLGPLFPALPGLTLHLTFSSKKWGEWYCTVSQLWCEDVCISTLSRAMGTSYVHTLICTQAERLIVSFFSFSYSWSQ